MYCIETSRLRRSVGRWMSRVASLGMALLSGCVTGPAPHRPLPPVAVEPRSGVVPAPAPPAAAAGAVRLPAPGVVRNLDEVRAQAARRIVAANPHLTYTDRPADVLLAIPVLGIDLNSDGTIRGIEVLRYPRQAKDTTQIAIDAVKRAAPFGDVSRLPRPWRFTETFLFNDDRRFKPRTLDD